ncbi:virulence factor MviN [Comamonas sp. lk]|uniref:virulence factor MviN n=1 Tax=Comamonas sp. lk TaxID=2201272 RepID=UPI000EAB853F|nr:virulence factor MviN [Comamonas sp. lk]
MQTRLPLWEQPYGKGLTLLICLFGFLGLMSGWMLLEADFSYAWRSSGRAWWALVLQAMLALNSAVCLTLAWLLWSRNRAAVWLCAFYVALGVTSQGCMFWYVNRLGSRADAFSIGFWLAQAVFWAGIVGYLHWLRRRGALR